MGPASREKRESGVGAVYPILRGNWYKSSLHLWGTVTVSYFKQTCVLQLFVGIPAIFESLAEVQKRKKRSGSPLYLVYSPTAGGGGG